MTILSWIETHPGTAGWVQGIGSIAAVAVAIAIPMILRRVDQAERKREQKLKARSLAIAIKPDLSRIIYHADLMISWCNDPLDFHGKKRDCSRTFDTPSTMSNNIDKFYLLGDTAGGAAQLVLAEVQNYNHASTTLFFETNGDRARWTISSAEKIANLATRTIDDLETFIEDQR